MAKLFSKAIPLNSHPMKKDNRKISEIFQYERVLFLPHRRASIIAPTTAPVDKRSMNAIQNKLEKKNITKQKPPI